MATPEDKFDLSPLSEEEIQRFLQDAKKPNDTYAERRRQVATREYGAWLVGFATEHSFVAESGYGVGEYEGADPERVELVLDFIELALNHAHKSGAVTRNPTIPFPAHEVEVVADDMVILAGRMRGQGVRYYLREQQEQAEFERPQVTIDELIQAG